MTDPRVTESILHASDSLVTALQVVGTVGFALSGAMAATRRRLDPFGIVVIGVIVAVGGGTLRDLLLGLPPFWIDSWWVLVVAAATSAIAIPIAAWRGTQVDSTRAVLTADAIGLAVFTVLGCEAAFSVGLPAGIAVVMGVVTGIVGGILRDLLVGEPIAVFSGQVYALAAVLGGVAFAVLRWAELHVLIVLWVPIIMTFALRMWAIQRDWTVRVPLARRIHGDDLHDQ